MLTYALKIESPMPRTFGGCSAFLRVIHSWSTSENVDIATLRCAAHAKRAYSLSDASKRAGGTLKGALTARAQRRSATLV